METLRVYGAAGEVTGSRYLLDDGEFQIGIDLGGFQGSKEDQEKNYLPLPYDASKVKGIVITHGHWDHVAALGRLPEAGFTGPIYATPETIALTRLNLTDSVNIMRQETDRSHILFNQENVKQVMKQMVAVQYNQPFSLGNYEMKLHNANHILGAASVEMTHQKTGHITVFSGDLGNDSDDDIIQPKEFIKRADTLVMESTYGDKDHGEEDVHEILAEHISYLQERGGTLLIPTFSIHRLQRMLVFLKEHGNYSNIQFRDNIPVYIDSAMGNQATGVYASFRDNLRPDLRDAKRNPFTADNFIPVRPQDRGMFESSKGNKRRIIIAGGGMLNGGPSVRHAQQLLGNESTHVLLTGYQAEGTLGRTLQEKPIDQPIDVVIDRQPVTVRASIDTINPTGHAGKTKLKEFVSHMEGLQQVILTHGEDDKREALAHEIRQEFGLTPELPRYGDIFNLSKQTEAMAAD